MAPGEQIEELINLISSLDRPSLIQQLRQFPAPFPIDFTADFLDSRPVDELRHILLALSLQSQRSPETCDPLAA